MWLEFESREEGEPRVVRVEGDRFTVGSAPEADLRLEAEGVPPIQAVLTPLPDGRAELRDEAGDGAVRVNGAPLAVPVVLDGDEEITLGDIRLRARLRDPDAPRADGARDDAALAAVAALAPDPLEAGEPEPVELRPWQPDAPAAAPGGENADAPREHARLRAGVRRATLVAGVAVAAALIAGILALTGVLRGDDGLSADEVVDEAAGGTLLVTAEDESRKRGALGAGTGWVLDAEEGLLVTNFHVVNGGSTFTVGPRGQPVSARVLGAAPCDDLAVLKVDDRTGLKTIPLGSQEDLKLGDRVVALGYPANVARRDSLTSTSGVVSVRRTALKEPSPDSPSLPDVIQTDTALNAGNSGGPLLDADGELVGVNTATVSSLGGQPVQGQSYAIGVDRVREVVADLRRGRSRGWGGFGIITPEPGVLARGRLPSGVIAGGSVAGSDAEQRLGRKPVLLTAINGRRLRTRVTSYCKAVAAIGSGERANLRVQDPSKRRSRVVRLRFR